MLICALVSGAIAGAALLSGVFRGDRAPRHEPVSAPEPVPSRAAVEPEAPAPRTAPTPPAARATLVATLRTSERRPVTLQVIPGERAASVSCLEAAASLSLASMQATPRAPVVTLAVPAERRLQLLASVSGEEVARWSTPLQALAAGATLEIEVPVPEEAARIRGLVVDRATSRPIAGASIEPEEASDAFRCRRATSAADGTFAIPDPPGNPRDAYFRVRAAGYASTDFPLGMARVDPGTPLRLELVGAATLAVTVRRSDGSPARDVGVEVATDWIGNTRVEGERAVTDASGRCSFPELPSGTELQLALYRGGRLLREEPDVSALHPGERRELAIEIDSARVRGQLVDQHGQPVVGAPVGLRAVTKRSGATGRNAFVAVVDAGPAGRFVFDDVPSGTWEVAADAAPALDLAAASTRVAIAPGARDVEVTLVGYRGLFISGQVLDPEGRPIAGEVITATAGDGAPNPVASSGPDGRFVLGPVRPLEYTVSSRSPSDGVRARAGASDVVVRLRPVAGIRGRVLDAQTGAPTRAELTIRALEGPRRSFATRAGADGLFQVSDLPPGRWRIEALTPTHRGLVPEVSLRAGETVSDLVLRLQEGAVLEIVSDVVHARLSAFDAQGRVLCEILATSRVSRCVVDPGQVLVREYAPAAAVTREQQVSVRRGERRRVEFGVAP